MHVLKAIRTRASNVVPHCASSRYTHTIIHFVYEYRAGEVCYKEGIADLKKEITELKTQITELKRQYSVKRQPANRTNK